MLLTPGGRMPRPSLRTHERSAPIRGLNVNTPLTSLADKGYALRLDNWICRPSGLHLRNGWIARDKNPNPVRSLLHYPGRRPIARSDGEWLAALLPNPGGVHLVMTASSAVGRPMPLRFDGTSWSVLSVTGADPTKLAGVIRHQRRLFFIDAGTVDLVYLGLDAIGGPVSRIPLGGIFSEGGEIVAIASMRGDGEDAGDQLAIVTSRGQFALYSGSSPDNASTWRLAGVWSVPIPVGPRCFCQAEGGMWLLTEAGLMAVPDVLAASKAKESAAATSVNVDLPATATTVIDSSAAGVTIVHCGDVQYVMDPETGGWSRFTGLAATCFLETPDGMWLGRADGTVAQYEGYADGDAAIPTVMIDGPAKYASPRHKTFRQVKLLWRIAQPYRARVEILPDYREPPQTWDSARTDSPCWMWEDLTDWRDTPRPWIRDVSSRLGAWRGIEGHGDVAALMIGARFHGVPAQYIGHMMGIDG